MDRPQNLRANDGLLLLGRLDGRLHGNPCADIYLARARLSGAAALAGLASVPISIHDLQAWIAGRSPPPRASEGLNDPYSVAAIFHLALSRDEDVQDPIGQATLNVLRSILDDRAEAEAYGRDDLALFGPLWRQVRAAADAPFPDKDLRAVAERVFELSRVTEQFPLEAANVVTVDGRAWALPLRSRDRNWLIAAAMPLMMHRARFTTRVIPSLVLLPKFLPPSPAALTTAIAEALTAAATNGLRELGAIERVLERGQANLQVTKRSKAPALARLLIAYPGLQASAVARLLSVTPQGARKLLAGLSAPSAPVLV